jgi:vanillate O-demethylase monooxygenase subunit
MNHPPSRTNLPRNCSFDPGDWRILARSWFPVAIAAQAAAGPIGAVLLDQPLVVYRIGMSFIVADDLCPHRGVPLSMGFQDGDGIRCAYHGLRFGAEGKCDHVPASPDMRIPDRLHLKTYPAVEKYGLIWTRLRGAAEADPEKRAIYGIPKMPHWDDPEFQQIVCPTVDIAGFAGRQMEGFLDVAHFGFVHRDLWRSRKHPRAILRPGDERCRIHRGLLEFGRQLSGRLKGEESRRFRMAAAFRGTSAVHRIDYGAFSG